MTNCKYLAEVRPGIFVEIIQSLAPDLDGPQAFALHLRHSRNSEVYLLLDNNRKATRVERRVWTEGDPEVRKTINTDCHVGFGMVVPAICQLEAVSTGDRKRIEEGGVETGCADEDIKGDLTTVFEFDASWSDTRNVVILKMTLDRAR